MKVALTLPKRDETARRPRVQLTLRVPARLGVELRLGGGELDVTNVAAVQVVEGVRPRPLRHDRRRRHRRAGPGRDRDRPRPARWPSRPATARSASPTSPARSRSRRDAATSAPAASAARRTLEGRDIEAELEDIAGPLRLTGSGGEVRVRDVRGRITAETRAHHAQADARHGGRDLGDDRARRDRADAAGGRDPARRAGDRRRHPHAGRADRPCSATATTPRPAARCAAAVRSVMLRTSRGDITVR